MSEEKKAYVSAAYGAAEAKQGAGDSGQAPTSNPSADGAELQDGQRQRGQAVLPGILGKQLRTAYGELLNAPVPDRINDLIKQLQSKEAGAAKPPRDGEESK
jgi:hypothetical protein